MGTRRLPSLFATLLFATLFAGMVSGCEEGVPQVVVLSSSGEQVELVSEPPNEEVYAEIGEVIGRARAVEKYDAFNLARNSLRNQTAEKGGTIVRIDNVDARLAWEVGETVVVVTGTAYKTK